MANPKGNPQNLLPPIRPGETRNPRGCSAKARARKAEKDRLAALRRAVFGKKGNPDRTLAPALLADGFNASKDELKALLSHEDAPLGVRMMLNEITKNPDFALKVYNTIYGKDTPQKVEHTGKDGSPLVPQPLTIEIIDSREQVDTADDTPDELTTQNGENPDHADIP